MEQYMEENDLLELLLTVMVKKNVKNVDEKNKKDRLMSLGFEVEV